MISGAGATRARVRSKIGLTPMAAAGFLTFLMIPSGVEAQQAPPGGAGASSDTVELIFEREVFEYPAFQRRNPFRPLTGDDAGPRFEELALLGVILSGDGAASVALLGPRGAAEGSRNWRVREGDVLGNVRVLAIRQRDILVEVDEFGIRESRVLELRRTEPQAEGEGASPEGVDEPEEDTPAPPPGGGGDGGTDPERIGATAGNGRNGGSA